MPLIPLALHLPPLLLRLLLLVLPVPPFVPSPTSPFPLDLPRGSRKHPSNRPCPARRPRPFAVNAHLAPANPTTAAPVSRPGAGIPPPAPDTSQTQPKCARPCPTRHSGILTRNPVFVPQPASDPPQSTPRRPKSFLEKTLIHAQDPEPAPPAASPAELRSVPSTRRTWIAADSSERRGRWHAPGPLRGRSGVAESRQPARPFRGLGPASRNSPICPKNAPKTLSRQPAPSGGGLARESSPLNPPTLFPPPPCRPCGHEGKACTLRVRSSTVIDESRS